MRSAASPAGGPVRAALLQGPAASLVTCWNGHPAGSRGPVRRLTASLRTVRRTGPFHEAWGRVVLFQAVSSSAAATRSRADRMIGDSRTRTGTASTAWRKARTAAVAAVSVRP